MLVGNGGRQRGGVLVLIRRDRLEDALTAEEVATRVLKEFQAGELGYYNVPRFFGLSKLRVLGGIIPHYSSIPIAWTMAQVIEAGRRLALTSPASLTFREW